MLSDFQVALVLWVQQIVDLFIVDFDKGDLDREGQRVGDLSLDALREDYD